MGLVDCPWAGSLSRGTHDPPDLARNNGVNPPPPSAEDGLRAHTHTQRTRQHARHILLLLSAAGSFLGLDR